MSQVPTATFSCLKCGKKFQWSTALAGRRVRCDCGAMLKFPSQPGGKSLAPQPNATASAKAGTPRDMTDPQTIKDFYAPLGLLLGGLLVRIIAAAWNGGGMVNLGLQLAAPFALMLPALLLAGRLRQINLGPLPTVAFKVAALSVAPGAIVLFFRPLLALVPFVGGLAQGALAFVAYFALLGALFDLDESDTWYCFCVLFLVHVAVYFSLRWFQAHGGI